MSKIIVVAAASVILHVLHMCRCEEPISSDITAVAVRAKRQFFPCNGCCGGTFGLQCCVYPGVLSSRCVTNADCLIENSVCTENCCQCPTGYCPNACGECVEVPKCLGDTCATDADCSKNVNHAVCTGGICQCSSAYKPVHNSCVARCLGDQCGTDTDCSTNVPHSICTLGTCQCLNGYVPNVCGRCVQPIVLPGVAAKVMKLAAAFDSAAKQPVMTNSEITTTPYHAYTKEANELTTAKLTTTETSQTVESTTAIQADSTATSKITIVEPDVILTGPNSIIRTDTNVLSKEKSSSQPVRRDWAYEDLPDDNNNNNESNQKFKLEVRNGVVHKVPLA